MLNDCNWNMILSLESQVLSNGLQYNNLKRNIPDSLLISIDGSKWMCKLLKVFFFGDYEFLSKAISIAGANGKYPGIYCLIDRDLMQIPRHLREKSVPRTMSLINQDYKHFKRDGAIRKNQSKYHNVTNKPLITCIDTGL